MILSYDWSQILDLSDYPILNTIVIFALILVCAMATAYIFKLKDIFVMIFFFCMYTVLFYAFGILTLNWLSVGIIAFSIACYAVFKKSGGNKEE